ncbi:MAG: cation transporter [Rhodospirillales bacterium]|nr:cation transporter [Rhodospirillales bacterium]
MLKLKVEGMNCGHCVKSVTEALSGVAGVKKVVEVSLERGEAVIDGTANAAALIAAVEERGFEAQVA